MYVVVLCLFYFVLNICFFFRTGNNVEPHYAARGISLGGNVETSDVTGHEVSVATRD